MSLEVSVVSEEWRLFGLFVWLLVFDVIFYNIFQVHYLFTALLIFHEIVDSNIVFLLFVHIISGILLIHVIEIVVVLWISLCFSA